MKKSMKKGPLFLGAMTILACSISGVLHAQDTSDEAPDAQGPSASQPEPPSQLATVTVTGTNIRGAQPVGNTVRVISAEELMKSAEVTLAGFLQSMPANFGGGVASATNAQTGGSSGPKGGNLTAGEGLNLRGLGVLSTLVLINGRRVAPSGQFGSFVDISNIPLSAISRIEILKDGASAVYGSDAVAGVVNIILKRAGDGATTGFHTGSTTRGGGTKFRLSQTWGHRWDSGSVFMGVELAQKENVAAADRAMFNGGDFSPYGGVNWRHWLGRVGFLANLYAGRPGGSGHVLYTVPPGAGTDLTPSDLIPAPGGIGNTHPLWSNTDILPEKERQSAFLGFNYYANDNVVVYGDLVLTHRKARFNMGYPVIVGKVPSTNPYHIPGVNNSFAVLVDDVGLWQRSEVDSYFFNLGADFMLDGGWHANANVSWSQQNQSRAINFMRRSNVMDKLPSGANAPSSIVCALMGLTPSELASLPGGGTAAQRFCAQLGYEPFNPYSSEPLSDQVLSELIGYGGLSYTSYVGQASFTVDGTLFELPAGPLKVAAGVDYRREHIEGELDFNYRSINRTVVPYGATERDVVSGYVEFRVPVIGAGNDVPFVQKLDFSLAGRYAKSTGLAGFSTFNPKFGFSLKPSDSWTLRGSWGTSYHAPPMRYMYNGVQPVRGGNAAFMRADLYMAPCDTTKVPLNGVVGTPGGSGSCSFSAIVVSGGAGPWLEPEESTTWTFGVDFAPQSMPGFNVNANYYHIRIDNRLRAINARALGRILSKYFATGNTLYKDNLLINPSVESVKKLLNDPRYLGQFGRGPDQSASDVAMIVYATQTNLGSMVTDGVDLSVNYRFQAPGGYAQVFARGTKILSYKVRATSETPWVSNLGRYATHGSPVPWQVRAGVAWSGNEWNASLSANFTDGFKCLEGCFVPNPNSGAPQPNNKPITVGSWTTFDLQASYNLDHLGGVFQDTLVSFSVNNLFDRDPPFFDTGTPRLTGLLPLPFNATTASILGRTVGLSVRKQW